MPNFLKIIFKPVQIILSLFYKNISEWRAYLYLKNKLGTEFSLHTISIGNLQMGGGGKTPLCLDLLNRFDFHHLNFIHSTRAYKSKVEGRGLIIDAQNENKDGLSAQQIGDEPKLILNNLKRGILSLGKKREFLLKKLSNMKFLIPTYDVLLLEDAYQHLKIERDENILLIDVTDTLKNFEIFPNGKLREDKKSIWRADLIVFTKVNLTSEQNKKLWYECVNKHKREDVKIIEVEYLSQKIVSVDEQKSLPIDSINQKNVILFSAIANAKSFADLISLHHAKVLKAYSFTDHSVISKSKYSEIVAYAENEDAMILCTEKDAVKMKSFPNSDKLFYVKLDIKFVADGEVAWDKIGKLNF